MNNSIIHSQCSGIEEAFSQALKPSLPEGSDNNHAGLKPKRAGTFSIPIIAFYSASSPLFGPINVR